MQVFVTYFDIIAAVLSMIFFSIAFYKSKNISNRLRDRDVRAILTNNIKEYEFEIRVKLAGKFLVNLGFLIVSISRRNDNCRFTNDWDMVFWLVLMLIWLTLVAMMDLRFSISKDYK